MHHHQAHTHGTGVHGPAVALATALVLGACAPAGTAVVDQAVSSTIAVCGAGLDQQTRLRIETAYEENLRFSAMVDVAAAIRAMLDPNVGDPAKYEAYLNCVERIHERTACRRSCDALHASCKAETRKVFDLCIADEIDGCIDHCQTFGLWSKAECVTDLCNWDSMSEEARGFHHQRCSHRRGYIRQQAECGADLGECLADC